MASLDLMGTRIPMIPVNLESRRVSDATIAPISRMGSPQEVADAALFLCSSKASFISGHTLVCMQTPHLKCKADEIWF